MQGESKLVLALSKSLQTKLKSAIMMVWAKGRICSFRIPRTRLLSVEECESRYGTKMSREPKGELDQKWRSLPWTREVAPKVENLSKRVLEMWSETPAVW